MVDTEVVTEREGAGQVVGIVHVDVVEERHTKTMD